jgi:hypothetical protein
MLLKLQADETVPYVRRQGAKELMIMWIVQEALPLVHSSQVQALTKSLNEMDGFDISEYTFTVGGRTLDVSKTPKELGLSGGQQVKLTVRERRSPRPSDGSLVPTESAAISSMPSQAFSSAADDEPTAEVAAEDDDERYLAQESGWFPFTFRTSGGAPIVSCINPFGKITEKDPFPITQDLCQSCSVVVAAEDPFAIVVDRHYKPMLLTQDVVEGYVEKLGGGTFQRWQRRFLSISEKAVDWYSEQPRQSEKAKICGHHLFARDGAVALELIEDPGQDPGQFPKCNDARYFYFAFKFSDPPQTTVLRVATAQEKTNFVFFIKQQIARLKMKRSNRNPAFWKRWVDSFLMNAADLAELTVHNQEQTAQLQTIVSGVEAELAKIAAQRPEAESLLALKTNIVQQLRKELVMHEEAGRSAFLLVGEAEQRVEEQRAQLRLKELEMGDELRKATMLERRMRDQRRDAEQRLEVLTQEIEELRREQESAFARWRKCEEEHDTKMNVNRDRKKGLFTFSVDGMPKAASPDRSSRRLQAAAGFAASASPARTVDDLGVAFRSPSALGSISGIKNIFGSP